MKRTLRDHSLNKRFWPVHIDYSVDRSIPAKASPQELTLSSVSTQSLEILDRNKPRSAVVALFSSLCDVFSIYFNDITTAPPRNYSYYCGQKLEPVPP